MNQSSQSGLLQRGSLPFWIVWAGVVASCVWLEANRLFAATDSPAGAAVWLTLWNAEIALPLAVLLILPVMILLKGIRRRQPRNPPDSSSVSGRQSLSGAFFVFCVSLGASMAIGLTTVPIRQGSKTVEVEFAGLPPAYHDEYSYLLQADTFAARRLSWPPMTVRPDLFHQMHVLNERRTASRYFPWTGLWMVPFLKAGFPVAGHWLAGALSAAFFYLGLRYVLRPGTAFVAGLLIAASPGIALFSNMLLAHHPTMLALSAFFWAIMRLQRDPSAVMSGIAGISLTLAMLGRPMTAAGFALPWGILIAWQLFIRSDGPLREHRMKIIAGFAIPLFLGFLALGVLNHNITGSFLRSPYQEYTDTYTPRHAYGFSNGVRGDAMQGPKVLKEYDRWAGDLTWSLAGENVKNRCVASAKWCLGAVPVVLSLLWAISYAAAGPDDQSEQRGLVKMLFAGVLSLHLLHIPYWYDGIMHWHYVFETAPLILILVSMGLAHGVSVLSHSMSRQRAVSWSTALVVSALLPGWISSEAIWGPSKVSAEINGLAYSRTRLEMFRRVMESEVVRKPALILVDEADTNPHLSYVINDPELKDEIIVARRPETAEELDELRTAFPDRQLYEFNPQTFVTEPLADE